MNGVYVPKDNEISAVRAGNGGSCAVGKEISELEKLFAKAKISNCEMGQVMIALPLNLNFSEL